MEEQMTDTDRDTKLILKASVRASVLVAGSLVMGIVLGEVMTRYSRAAPSAPPPTHSASVLARPTPSAVATTIVSSLPMAKYDEEFANAMGARDRSVEACEKRKRGIAVISGGHVWCLRREVVITEDYIQYPKFPW
jgi:hypothetical protein